MDSVSVAGNLDRANRGSEAQVTEKQTLSEAQQVVSDRVAEILDDVEVQKTLTSIHMGSGAFRQDGTIFRNREGRLPKKLDRTYYTEWTVSTPGLSHR